MKCMKLWLSFEQQNSHVHFIQPRADVPEALLEVAMNVLSKLSWLLEFVAELGSWELVESNPLQIGVAGALKRLLERSRRISPR